jgi:hypothetical protein
VHAYRSVPDKSDRAYRWQRLFRGQESELRELRHWLIELLPDSPGRDDLISVAVELGTNAVQHTASGNGGWFTVEVACLGPVLRVSVTDEGAERGPSLAADPADLTDPTAGHTDPADATSGLPPAVGTAPDTSAEPDLDLLLDFDEDAALAAITGARCDRGRGLIIVRALAVTCGVCGNASGRTVWAEVAQTPAGPTAPAPAPLHAPAPAHTRVPIHTRTPNLTRPGSQNGQGRSSRPSASSAMASSRTL